MVKAETAERIEQLSSWSDDWSGLRVAVLGLGVTGFSVADTLVELGCQVRVIYAAPDEERERLLDAIGAERARSEIDEVQGDELQRFAPDLVVVSPGYRPDHPLTTWAEQHGIAVWGDIELGWRLRDKTARIADWICITGTNGKTTTAQLTAHMLMAGGLRAIPVGNIGVPILDALRDPQGYDVLVVELSSFQLHRLGMLSPFAATCLNIADDHLSWHGSFEAYVRAKAKVYANTQVACVYNRADPRTEQMVVEAEVVEGARAISFGLDSPPPSGFGVVDGILVDRGYHETRRSEAFELVTLAELRDRTLDAPHLVQNILAAAALARARGVEPDEIARAVLAFTVDPHRGQLLPAVPEHPGVRWIDDSKATNAHAAAASLRALERVVWIVGGVLKGIDIGSLVAEHRQRLRGVVVIGTERDAVLEALRQHAPTVPMIEVLPGETEDTMSEVVAAAITLARAGDTVLLSPAAASTDQYKDYSDRGRRFQAAVQSLGGGGGSDHDVPSGPDGSER